MTSQLGDPVAPPVVKETAGPAAKREKGLRRLLALGRGIGRTRRHGSVTNGGPVRPEPTSEASASEAPPTSEAPVSKGAPPASEAPASEGASSADAGRGDSSGPPPGDVLGWTNDPRRRSGRRGGGRSGRASAEGSGTSARRGRAQRPGGPQTGGQQASARQARVKGGEAGAGRQRKLSARATAERAIAAQEAAARRRSAAAAAELLWTRVPEKPTRYRLLTRLSDMRHGWLDGKSGLPRLPEIPKLKSAVEPAAPIQQAGAMPLPAHAPAHALTGPPPAVESSLVTAVPATPPAWLQTPRMVLLGRRALELARAEEQACVADCAAYRNGISRFRKLRDAAEEDLDQARATLALAKHPLTEHELSTRRLAEQSTQDRPESFVRGRRQAEWDRRLAAATRAVQTATARLADATREAELREALIRDRVAVARAAALRHHEFHMRRIATYLQQLVRTHKQGADLNMLLMRYPVGPGLPEWTRDTHASDGASSQ